MKRGFTLVEMLVVIGILAVLVGASIAGFSHAADKARNSLCQELVHNTATALTKVLQDEDGWPQRILQDASGSCKLTDEVGGELARRKVLSLTYRETTNDKDETVYKLVGLDQCGIVSPWARDVIKRLAAKGAVPLSAKVPSGGTIDDHVLRFAVDDDYDGIVHVNGEGGGAAIRASAAVWCCGKDGKFGTKDDVKSWSKGQERGK